MAIRAPDGTNKDTSVFYVFVVKQRLSLIPEDKKGDLIVSSDSLSFIFCGNVLNLCNSWRPWDCAFPKYVLRTDRLVPNQLLWLWLLIMMEVIDNQREPLGSIPFSCDAFKLFLSRCFPSFFLSYTWQTILIILVNQIMQAPTEERLLFLGNSKN